MIHFSLFSGIGGFDLASEWMGWKNYASCEINPFGRKVLSHYWPEAYHHDDIKTLTYEKINQELTARFGTEWRSDDVILTGGFPCQPYSAAGKRLGKEDERHLWPEMLRIIREVKPTWIVGENVFGIVNWSNGLVFEEVQADLEIEGYEIQAFLLPAASVNAPHRRDRVWFVAHANRSNDGRNTGENEGESGKERLQERHSVREPFEPSEVFGFAADTDNARNSALRGGINGNGSKKIQKWQQPQSESCGFCDTRTASDTSSIGRRQIGRKRKSGQLDQTSEIGNWENFPTQSPIRTGNDGFPTKLDGITFPKWRNESIKAAGNAVVPQVVYQIFKAINKYSNQ